MLSIAKSSAVQVSTSSIWNCEMVPHLFTQRTKNNDRLVYALLLNPAWIQHIISGNYQYNNHEIKLDIYEADNVPQMFTQLSIHAPSAGEHAFAHTPLHTSHLQHTLHTPLHISHLEHTLHTPHYTFHIWNTLGTHTITHFTFGAHFAHTHHYTFHIWDFPLSN
jgi:hypothetical protein